MHHTHDSLDTNKDKLQLVHGDWGSTNMHPVTSLKPIEHCNITLFIRFQVQFRSHLVMRTRPSMIFHKSHIFIFHRVLLLKCPGDRVLDTKYNCSLLTSSTLGSPFQKQTRCRTIPSRCP